MINHVDDEDWALGLGIPTIGGFQSGRERFHGEGQALMLLDELGENQDFIDPNCGMVVGTDNRVYEPRRGLIRCLAPAKVGEDSPKVYVDEVNWDSLPRRGELSWLFEHFFSRYDREVLMLLGNKRDGTGRHYHVPEQEGASGSVTWKADNDEMGEFLEQARWVGTIHIHPCEACEPSQTDIDDWAAPEKSGLHIVFGRDGSYTVNGAIAGRTFPLLSDSVVGYEGNHRMAVEYTTSRGRSLEELLKVPTAIVVRKKPALRRHRITLPSDNVLIFGAGLDVALQWCSALPVEPDEMEDLRVVSHGGRYYIMTPGQLDSLEAWCDPTELPTAKRLRIRSVKEGT